MIRQAQLLPLTGYVHGHPFRGVITVAATIALLIFGMMGAQASGVDVFGALARWTSQVFHLGSNTDTVENADIRNSIKRVLNDYDFPKGLVPVWFPEGFVVSEPEVYESSTCTSVQVTFFHSDGREFFKNPRNIFEIGVGPRSFIGVKQDRALRSFFTGKGQMPWKPTGERRRL